MLKIQCLWQSLCRHRFSPSSRRNRPVCFFLPSGGLGWCPARGQQNCAPLLRGELEFSPSSVPFCKAERQECCAQCQSCPFCTMCVHQTKTRVKFCSLEGSLGCFLCPWCFSRECSFILAGRNDSVWTDRDRCLFSPSPLQSRVI